MPTVWCWCPVTRMYRTTQTESSPARSRVCNLRLILESYLSQRRQSTSKTRLAPEATKTAPSHPVSRHIWHTSALIELLKCPHNSPFEKHQMTMEAYFLKYLSQQKSNVNRPCKVKASNLPALQHIGDIIGQTIAFYCFEEELHWL